mmetsp:Transcript_79299/g.212110  ORF Transcript_79299/g.212110 Transcript_79299/m.212110 type:complete len:180 (+) Transcript_79299:25-564(+)
MGAECSSIQMGVEEGIVVPVSRSVTLPVDLKTGELDDCSYASTCASSPESAPRDPASLTSLDSLDIHHFDSAPELQDEGERQRRIRFDPGPPEAWSPVRRWKPAAAVAAGRPLGVRGDGRRGVVAERRSSEADAAGVGQRRTKQVTMLREADEYYMCRKRGAVAQALRGARAVGRGAGL